MFPTLFSLGPLTIHSFGLMLACAFICACAVLRRIGRGTHRDSDYTSSLLVWCMVSGVAGARIAYVIEHWSAQFKDTPGAIIRIDQGGLMFYGGLIGALLALAIFARVHKEKTLDIFDFVAVALPLGQTFGRIGCFLNGCCHGRICHGFPGVTFPHFSGPWQEQFQAGLITRATERSLPVLPSQLFEAVGCALIFLLLLKLYRFNRRGLVTGVYLACYGALRFCIEFTRGDERISLGEFPCAPVQWLAAHNALPSPIAALSIGQLISIIAIAASIPILVIALRGVRSSP